MKVFPDRLALAAVCQKYGVERLSLFGSVLNGTNTPASDVDFLAEFDEKACPTFIDVANLEADLSQLLGGRKVDVRTPADLSAYFGTEVIATADLQYAA